MASAGKLEIEIKLPYTSAAKARAALGAAGFRIITRRAFETSTLYDTPAGALRRQGCGVRYRHFRGEHIITYKGPASLTATGHKSREERETTVADPAAVLASWAVAGLVPSFRYEKYRTLFSRPGERGHAMLDETPLGTFVELEGSSRWIDRMAKTLGFSPAQYIHLSYAALQAEACRLRRTTFEDLVFTRRGKSS